MSYISPVWTMLGLDLFMIVYTLWVLSLSKIRKSLGPIAVAMLVWLTLLHIALSNELLFAKDIAGVTFLIIIFGAVGLVGAVLLFIPRVRELMLGLDQSQLLLLQGVRVFFGAAFLMQAALGSLPAAFGIIDGFTHVGAGFVGLVAAFAVAADKQGSRRAWFANLFGLVDILIVASTLALILLPEIGPHHSMMYAVFFPAPLWLWFHLVSIRKLIVGQRQTSGVPA